MAALSKVVSRAWRRFILPLFLILSFVLAPFSIAAASNLPRFNQMDGDQEFLVGRNLTKGQNDYGDPVSADPSDTVRVRVYYHNNALQDDGEPGAAANNTRLKVNLPTGEATTHIISASLSADNAATVTGTVVNGQEVGLPNLRLNSSAVTTLSLVNGSVKWYPNRSTTPVTLPNGQSGDGIINGDGILLGDILGCWQFAGFVTLDIKLSTVGTPKIIKEKAAINVNKGVDARTVKADPGDVIAYSLKVRNTGTAATLVTVTDDLSDVLAYAKFLEATDGGSLNGAIINYPPFTLEPGAERTVGLAVQVKPVEQWPNSDDFVMTNIFGNVVDVPVNPPTKTALITIDKAVRNLSRGNADFGFSVREVKRGDMLEYQVTVYNKGDIALTGVRIRDQHDPHLQYVFGSAQLKRNNQTVAIVDNVAGNGFVLPSPLLPGERVDLLYRMSVLAGAPGDVCQVNNAFVQADGLAEIKDSTEACVVVPPVAEKPAPPQLPVTGPAGLLLTVVGGMGGSLTSLRYFKARKMLRRAQNSISIL